MKTLPALGPMSVIEEIGHLAAGYFGDRNGITCPSERAWLRMAVIAIVANVAKTCPRSARA